MVNKAIDNLVLGTADMSSSELRKTATHVAVGNVQAVYEYIEYMDKWVYKRFVTEVRILENEKGEGLKKGDLLYARYWQRTWQGEGAAPSANFGHKALPCIGETQRIYLTRNAPDGFGENKDGGFNVIGANGFEKIMGMKK